MKFKRFCIIFIILCLFISIASVSAVDENSTIDISKEENSANVELPNNDTQTFDELRVEIENSSSGSVINLKNNYYIYNNTNPIRVGDNITIDGGEEYCIFDGNSSEMLSLFNIMGDNVVLKNIVFSNWNISDSYNIVEWFGENGTIVNCYFTNNTGVRGGGIDWSGTNGTVDGCYFENNYAKSGGAIYVYATRTGIRNSVFKRNFADENGGAIFIRGKDILIEECDFDGCSAGEDGGAIYLFSTNCNISNCLFENCQADNGGAIYLLADDINIDTNYFFNNSATNGGAIFSDGEGNMLNNSIFIENHADESGGAVMVDYKQFNVDNCEFANNSAELAGALCLEDGGIVVNSEFENNSAGIAGAVYAGDFAVLGNSAFTQNTAEIGAGIIFDEDGEIFDSNFTKNIASKTAGAVYANGDLNLNNTHFKQNNAEDESNNILASPSSTISIDDKSTSDSPMVLRDVSLLVNPVSDAVYGDLVSITLNVISGDTAIDHGFVSCEINGKLFSADVGDGKASLNLAKLGAGNYNVFIVYNGEDYVKAKEECNFTIYKNNAVITAKKTSFVINYAKKYSITLKDAQNRLLGGEKVTFMLNGKTIGSAITNAKGVATIKITSKMLKNAKAGTKKLVVKLSGNFNTAGKTVKVKINKEKTKISAKKKTFKASLKTKKFTVSLKNSKGKAVKKVKVTLKVKGKTYKAKTNSKGKATFKITKLIKKGKFNGVIKFKTNSYYKAATKKVKLTIR